MGEKTLTILLQNGREAFTNYWRKIFFFLRIHCIVKFVLNIFFYCKLHVENFYIKKECYIKISGCYGNCVCCYSPGTPLWTGPTRSLRRRPYSWPGSSVTSSSETTMKASTKQDSSSELSLLGLFPYYCGVLTEILIFHKNVRFPSSSPTLNSTSVDPWF